MFAPKIDEVRGYWRKFYEKELHNLYTSLNIIVTKIKENKTGQTCGTTGETSNACGSLVIKPEWKRQFLEI
jgi:hypothetical protein